MRSVRKELRQVARQAVGAFEAKRENGRGWCEDYDGFDVMVWCF